MLTLSDEELVVRCKTELPGNTRSYELLVQRHMNKVFSLVYRIVCNKEEAEDITQEVFVKVYNSLKKFEQQAAFSSWLYRIATNAALDALDKTKRRPQSAAPLKNVDGEAEADLLSLQTSPNPGPEDAIIQTELRECISRVLKKLDKEQAKVLVLRDFDDLSYDEIAQLGGMKLSAVKMRIHRARLAFQEVFDQFCGSVYLTVKNKSASLTKVEANAKEVREGERIT